MATKRSSTARSKSFIEAIRVRIIADLLPEEEMSDEQRVVAASMSDPALWEKKFFEIWSEMSETERLAIVATFFIQLLPGRKFLEGDIWGTSLDKLWGGLTPVAQAAVVDSFFALGTMSELRKNEYGSRQ